MTTADIGVFGGSGFYSFLEGTETVEVETPYGSPSARATSTRPIASRTRRTCGR
jgi:purine nucleoside phosphorylase